MGVTLEDVGRHCGVSRSTVSRVINDSPLVNQATKERVLKAIEELHYAPNFIARSLTNNRTETLAVTLPDITGGVFPEILAGMDEAACERGYHLLVVFVGGARPQSETISELITHRRVDAILSVASTVGSEEAVHMAENSLPFVCVAERCSIPSVPSVTFDDAGGAMQATRLLLSRGRRKLVQIRGPLDNFDAEERSKGFRRALEEAGVPYDESREAVGDFKREGGMRAMEELLARNIEFDGIFAGNDEMAIGVVEVLSEKGISIPHDTALVGFDNIEPARFLGLSSVRVPARELGRVAVRQAFDFIDGNTPIAPEVLGTQVVERGSTRISVSGRPIKITPTIKQ